MTSVLLKRSGVKRTVHGRFFLAHTVGIVHPESILLGIVHPESLLYILLGIVHPESLLYILLGIVHPESL